MPALTTTTLQELSARHAGLEPAGEWPVEQLQLLAQAGAFGWTVARQWGGSALADDEIVQALLDLGEACLTTAFVMSQYQAALHRLSACQNFETQTRWLPVLAAGKAFATVGLSHLTTSRSRGPGPAVVAAPAGQGGYRLTGHIPWVTGGAHADIIVVGATTPDGEQILALIERNAAGVTVAPALQLLALTASCTGSIELQDVDVPVEHLLAGPAPSVMKVGATGGTGSLTTSALALAAGTHALHGLQQTPQMATEWGPVVDQLVGQQAHLQKALLSASRQEADAWSAEDLRFETNSFAVRTAQCWIAAAKGTGFVTGHPAERAIREAMFFYVWSCPTPVLTRHWQSLAAPPELT